MSKKRHSLDTYSLDKLHTMSLAVAEEVHVALQTWEAAKPLLIEGAFNDILQTDSECRPLLVIARGGSVAASMALARVWDQSYGGKIKLDLFPPSFRQEASLQELASRSDLSLNEVRDRIARLETLVANCDSFGKTLKSLTAWRNQRLAHRNPFGFDLVGRTISR